jgi:general secretion pathway protein F/type IV pilus assembly protein PilC
MPLFIYKTFSEKNKVIQSTLSADDLQDAKLKLVRLQIKAFSLRPATRKMVLLSNQEVLLFTKELYRLLEAGLPLFEALSALEEKSRGDNTHSVLVALLEDIQKGSSFSAALRGHPMNFSMIYQAMVQNGEKTGSLPSSLKEIARFLEKQIELKKQIVAAILYPSLLTCFCIVIFSVLLLFVIPSLSELFEGRSLHPFTSFIFFLSRGMCSLKYSLLIGVSAVALTGAFLSFSAAGKRKLLLVVSNLPFLKKFFLKAALIRFARGLGTLLDGGMPLLSALSQAKLLMNHPGLEKVIAFAEEKMSQGELLSHSLKNQPLVPPLISRMLGIAEQSGKLAFTMEQMSQIYEDELEASLTHFTAVAQPILLLILGGLVGFVLLSVLLPLTDMSSFIN